MIGINDVSRTERSDGSAGTVRRVLHSTAIPAPRFFYSPCIQIGPIVQVSGMVGLDAATGRLVVGGPGAEVDQIFRNLRQAMPDYQLSFDDLLIARIFTTRFDAFDDINAAWEAALVGVQGPPARTAVGVTTLPLGASVEIEFGFVKPA